MEAGKRGFDQGDFPSRHQLVGIEGYYAAVVDAEDYDRYADDEADP